MGEDTIRQQELEQERRDWNTHITSWQASRLSRAKYCRRHELKFHQFVYWRRKFVSEPNVSFSLVQVIEPEKVRKELAHLPNA